MAERRYIRILYVYFARMDCKRVKNLQKGFEQRDVGQLALETHSLKSVAATLGANELAVMARKINQDCRNCSEGITSVQWQELIRLYQNVIEEFERNILEEDTEDAVL